MKIILDGKLDEPFWNTIIGIDQFLTQHSLTMPILLGTKALQHEFQISAYPSYYLIDKNGQVKARNKGYTTELGMKLNVSINR